MSRSHLIESIYTDGACSGNPGPGGWGVVIYFSDGSIHEMGDADGSTTNNKMEMQAAIAALEFFRQMPQTKPITLYTDSEYLINSVTKWMAGWKKRGWKKSNGKPLQNLELLLSLDQLNNQLVNWQYVRGHSGNVGNERCDVIARSFAKGVVPSLQQLTFFNSQNSLHFPGKVIIATLGNCSSGSLTPKESTENHSFMEEITASTTAAQDEKLSFTRVEQLRNLVETLHIADEIAAKGYLITSSELADLMNVHASAVTSRGDQWRWRNWIVSRVRREGNQILWELERGDRLGGEDEL